ncbi:MAG: 4Fe-4S dicluster domain-containing protein [Treponema sp.]|nr:4Fe-4S dicluster domain-containing protein [Treponema sp.]
MSNVSMLDESRCYSCRSCLLSCPNGAIEMSETVEGFQYPKVSRERCIDCGICAARCPALNPPVRDDFVQISRIVWQKDGEKLFQSTSGGLFAGLAERVLDECGVVFGAAYGDDLKVSLSFVESEGELWKLKGSKYVESQTNDSFKRAKEFLDGGRKVFYSGTPCQIAGLKKYLAKDYDNLFTADLICHGVPSQKLWLKYLEWLGNKTGGTIVYYGFRDKDVGGWSCGGKTKTKTKTKTKVIDGSCDPYYASFLRCETYRESCYSCPFSSMARPGDVTMGDFFEVSEFYPDLDRTKGISLLIINNEKGERFFSSVEDKFEVLPISESQYLPVKGNLKSPSIRPCVRDDIYSGIDSLPPNEFFGKFRESHISFKAIYKAKRLLRYGIFKIIPRFVKNWGKRILKKWRNA